MDLLTLIAKLAEADFGRLVGIGVIVAILVWFRLGTLNAGIRKLHVDYDRERSKSQAELDGKRIEQDREDSLRQFEANKLLAASNNRLADVIDMTVRIVSRIETQQTEDSTAIKLLTDNYEAVRVKANIIHERADAIHKDMGKAFKATGEFLTKKAAVDKQSVGETNLLIGNLQKEIEDVKRKVEQMAQTLTGMNQGLTAANLPKIAELQTTLGAIKGQIETVNSHVLELKRKGTGELKADPLVTVMPAPAPPPTKLLGSEA